MRKSNKYQRAVRPLDSLRLMGGKRYETGADGLEYQVVRIVRGTKPYVCPGCNGIISVGEAHEVAWTEEHWFGAQAGQQDRRHWHTSCWQARGRRRG